MKLKTLLFTLMIGFVFPIQAQDLKLQVNKKGKVGFVDSVGVEVIKCQYDNAFPFENGVAIVSRNKKSGLVNAKGEVVLPLSYTKVNHWNENLYLIQAGNKHGLCDSLGQIVLPVKYSLITKSNCYGKALVAVGGKATPNEDKTFLLKAKYGVINNNGEILIEPQYSGLFEFSWEGKNANIYHEGRRLEFSYHYITDTLKTDCSYVGFSKNWDTIDQCGIMDGNGQILLNSGLYNQVMEPCDSMVRYYLKKREETWCGYHNLSSGNQILAAKFSQPMDNISFWTHGDFIGDIAPVNGEKWSFIDKAGTVLRTGYNNLIHNQPTALWAARNGEGKWEVFDENNKDIVSLSDFEDISFPTFENDQEVFGVKKDGVYGCINRDGDVVIPFEYELILSNIYDVIPVRKEGKWGLVTPDSTMLVTTEYAGLLFPSERKAQDFWVMKADSLYYHYRVAEGESGTTGYKAATNFMNGISCVVPVNMELRDIPVNRAQVYLPNTDKATIDATQITDFVNSFCYILGDDDVVLLDRPVSVLYIERVMKEIERLGKKNLTDSEKKRIILNVTKENRSYDLKSTINEEEWDY